MIEPVIEPCRQRWPASSHWSDHVCDLNAWHDGSHHCERCDAPFDLEGEKRIRRDIATHGGG